MPLWALTIVLATGRNTRLFGVLDQNETRFFTYVSQRAESQAATVMISLGSFQVAGDFVLQLIRLESLGSELELPKRASNFHPVDDKFAMCTGQEVTFEPTSNAHAGLLRYHDTCRYQTRGGTSR